MNRVITEINLTSESMLTSVERFLADSGNAMEEKLASGGEIWLRDVGTAKSGLVLEGWLVDHQLRTVVIGGDEHVHATKESGNDKAKNVSSEEDREFCFSYYFAYDMLLKCVFLFIENLIQNSGIGRSWMHIPLINLFLRKPKSGQWRC